MTQSTMQLSALTRIEEQNFMLIELTLDKILHSPEIVQYLDQWNGYWNLPNFRAFLEHHPKSHAFLIFAKDYGFKIPIAFMIFQFFSPPLNPPFGKVWMLFNPQTFHENSEILVELLQSETMLLLIKLASNKNTQITKVTDLSMIFFELCYSLMNSKLQDFSDRLTISAEEYWKTSRFSAAESRFYNVIGSKKSIKDLDSALNETSSENIKWVRYDFPYDLLRTDYYHSIHFIGYLQGFDIQIPPSKIKWIQHALALYTQYENNTNPFSPENEPKEFMEFTKLLREKCKYNEIRPYLQSLRNKINKGTKLGWGKLLYFTSQNSPKFAHRFVDLLESQLRKTIDAGFRTTFFSPHSKEGERIIQDHRWGFIMMLYDSLPTEGSQMSQVVADDGSLLPISDIGVSQIQKALGVLCCLLEYKHPETGEWMFVGYSNAHPRKIGEEYTNQLACGVMILEPFRGFSFGKLLSFWPMGQITLRGLADIIIENSSINNLQVLRMVSKIGFQTYGFLDSSFYSPKSIQHSDFTTAGQYRMWWPAFSLTSQPCKYDGVSQSAWEQIHLVNKELHRRVQLLEQEGILHSIIP